MEEFKKRVLNRKGAKFAKSKEKKKRFHTKLSELTEEEEFLTANTSSLQWKKEK